MNQVPEVKHTIVERENHIKNSWEGL